jgi:hypothetical protein
VRIYRYRCCSPTVPSQKWATFKAAADGNIAEWEESEIFKAVPARLVAHLLAKYGEGLSPGVCLRSEPHTTEQEP